YACGNCRAERNEFHAFEFGAIAGDGREREMRIDADVSVTGEMFRRGDRAVLLDAAYKVGNVLGDSPRIFAERPDVDDRVVRVIVDVRHRREDPVDPGSARFARREFAGGVRETRIAR